MHSDVSTIRCDSLDRLQIRLRDLFGLIVRVTYLIAAEFTFSTNLTRTCHVKTLHNAWYRLIAALHYHKSAGHAREKCGEEGELLDMSLRVV